jgi:hypothetical protein
MVAAMRVDEVDSYPIVVVFCDVDWCDDNDGSLSIYTSRLMLRKQIYVTPQMRFVPKCVSGSQRVVQNASAGRSEMHFFGTWSHSTQ